MNRGRFIALEGIDGSGTTTQTQLLISWLQSRQIKAVGTSEPSGGPVGTLIRGALTGRVRLPDSAGGAPLTQQTIALLFAADRLDHYQAEIDPALKKGLWVVSDRYLDSSLAYQGALIEEDWVAEINRYAPRPDLTIYLDIDPETALERIAASRSGTELFERKDTLTQVRAQYQKLYRTSTAKVVLLDGSASLDSITQEIQKSIEYAFNRD